MIKTQKSAIWTLSQVENHPFSGMISFMESQKATVKAVIKVIPSKDKVRMKVIIVTDMEMGVFVLLSNPTFFKPLILGNRTIKRNFLKNELLIGRRNLMIESSP